jgi:hypothetical protein
MKKYLAICLLALTVSGCAIQTPTLNFTPEDILPTGGKINAELKTINVSVAKDDERLGDTQVGFGGNSYEQSFRQSLKEALEESIAKSAVFNDLSTNKLSLTAKVMKFQTSPVGINFDTDLIIRYQLLDRATGKLMFTRDIASTGRVPGDYAFMGSTRHAEARNVAVRENIKQFIGSLGEFQGFAPLGVKAAAHKKAARN